MFFPPPGVRIRRTLEALTLPNTPTLIAERNPQRVLVTVFLDSNVAVEAFFAGSADDLSTTPVAVLYYSPAPEFWGSEEIWARCNFPNTASGGPILVQSVFYD